MPRPCSPTARRCSAGSRRPIGSSSWRVCRGSSGRPRSGPVGASPEDFLGDDGRSLVDTGIAVLPADGGSLASKVRNAAAAGAEAVLVYGSVLPAGGLGYDEQTAIPVFTVPGDVGTAIVEAATAGLEVTVAAERASAETNAASGELAGFSSHGPSTGASKPDLVAPGVALVAPDAAPAGSDARYAAVTGTSAAAAVAAGAAALVLDARPGLDPAALAGVLVGSARPLTTSPSRSPPRARGSSTPSQRPAPASLSSPPRWRSAAARARGGTRSGRSGYATSPVAGWSSRSESSRTPAPASRSRSRPIPPPRP